MKRPLGLDLLITMYVIKPFVLYCDSMIRENIETLYHDVKFWQLTTIKEYVMTPFVCNSKTAFYIDVLYGEGIRALNCDKTIFTT